MNTAQAGRNIARVARSEARERRTHIQLREIPKTALLSDIRRTVAQARLQGVSDVAIDYHRFCPKGNAWLTLVSPDYLESNLRALRHASLSSLPIKAHSSPPPTSDGTPARTRGAKGRAQASGRGLMNGNGPHAGIRGSGRNVVVWGLPGKLTEENFRQLLRNYKLAGSEGGRQEVFRVDRPALFYSTFSRFLVRLSSVSEAYRLVRRLHMAFFQPEKHGQKYQTRARVVY